MSTSPAPRPVVPTRTALLLMLLALVLVPAPLLPPSALVATVQSALGLGRSAAYLAAVLALHTAFYGSLGVLAALAVTPGATPRARWARLGLAPVLVVGSALLVRSLKLGHVPMLANAAVPMAACAAGTAIGLLCRQHGVRATLITSVLLGALLAALHWPGVRDATRQDIEARLQRIVAAGPTLPSGDERFCRMLQLAFAPLPAASGAPPSVDDHSAAILALGIVVGHERLGTFAGIDPDGDLVRAAAGLRKGTTLRDREDWARHFCVSAALAVVGNDFVSDLGGLLKEELDALTDGTGFSFGDLAADRAGVRFAAAATDSARHAAATGARLQAGVATGDVVPPIDDLAENLTVEQFRRDYDGVGAPRYRAVLADIEARLLQCAMLRDP